MGNYFVDRPQRADAVGTADLRSAITQIDRISGVISYPIHIQTYFARRIPLVELSGKQTDTTHIWPTNLQNSNRPTFRQRSARRSASSLGWNLNQFLSTVRIAELPFTWIWCGPHSLSSTVNHVGYNNVFNTTILFRTVEWSSGYSSFDSSCAVINYVRNSKKNSRIDWHSIIEFLCLAINRSCESEEDEKNNLVDYLCLLHEDVALGMRFVFHHDSVDWWQTHTK